MASESPDGGGLSTLPDDLTQWLDERAAQRGISRTTLLERLVDAYRLATESDTSLEDADDLETVVERIVASRDLTTTDELESVEEDFESQLEEVRRRVVQVKQEADAKAPEDHTHEAFDDLSSSIADLRSDVETLQSTVSQQGSDLDHLTETVDSLDEKLTRVAHAVVQLRSAESADGALDALKHEAALHDIERAKCGACDESVHVALMTEPACPHCEAQVRGVEPGSGFFGKPHLTGERTHDDE